MSGRIVDTEVLQTRVSASSFDAAVALLAHHVEARSPAVFCNANVFSVMLAREDAAQRARLERATYVMADGMPVVWTLKHRGLAAERVHGDDFMFASLARFPHWRHFLLGGGTGQPERVERGLRERFPAVRVVGAVATPVRPVPQDHATDILRTIAESGADVVWVGMGTPAQDEWMDAHRQTIGVPQVGVGSAFNVLAGATVESPDWVKRSGLQWLHRAIQEPRRLGPRYLKTNPQFMFHIAIDLIRRRGT